VPAPELVCPGAEWGGLPVDVGAGEHGLVDADAVHCPAACVVAVGALVVWGAEPVDLVEDVVEGGEAGGGVGEVTDGVAGEGVVFVVPVVAGFCGAFDAGVGAAEVAEPVAVGAVGGAVAVAGGADGGAGGAGGGTGAGDAGGVAVGA